MSLLQLLDVGCWAHDYMIVAIFILYAWLDGFFGLLGASGSGFKVPTPFC
jgi:hypothetical protein